jgi:hypothetical protein
MEKTTNTRKLLDGDGFVGGRYHGLTRNMTPEDAARRSTAADTTEPKEALSAARIVGSALLAGIVLIAVAVLLSGCGATLWAVNAAKVGFIGVRSMTSTSDEPNPVPQMLPWERTYADCPQGFGGEPC